MENLKQNFLKKYGIWEYILLLLGLAFLYRVGEQVIIRPWEDFTLEIVGIMILFTALGSLLVAKPMAILDLARKKIGLDTKGNVAAKGGDVAAKGGGGVKPKKPY